jgi:hypothetical protein
MLLLKEYMNAMYVPKDVSNIIKGNLHEVTHINPVLDGKLIYTPHKGKKTTFEIKHFVNTNGCIDLPNEIFGGISEYFLLTTDLEQFFSINEDSDSINEDSDKLVMLIAPRFLIEEKIGSTAKPFKPIMDNWKEEQAPIGIFWRMQSWDVRVYMYLISNNLDQISSMGFDNLLNRSNPQFRFRDFTDGNALIVPQNLENISCSFVNQNKD